MKINSFLSFMALMVLALAVTMVSGCGGGGPEYRPPPTPQVVASVTTNCTGTAKAAVVYVGTDAPAASIADGCFYTAPPELLADAVAKAKADTHLTNLYFISNGNTAVLDYIASGKGSAQIMSLWFPQAWTGDFRGSISSVHVNGGACPTITNHDGPTLCGPAAAFDMKTAISQLSL